MKTFKALIEIKRNRRNRNINRFKTNREKRAKKEPVDLRLMYIRGNSMVEAYDSTRRVRYSSLKWITQISRDTYLKGIGKVSDHY